MPKQNPEIRLQITLVSPIPNVMFALQRGKDELVDKTLSSGADLAFSFVVNYVLADDQPNFRGPFVQGPRGGRFVYINSGELAGQASSPWPPLRGGRSSFGRATLTVNARLSI